MKATKRKQRLKTVVHRIDSLTLDFTQRGGKRRLLRVQRYRKPLKIDDIDLSKNPEKLSFAILSNQSGRLEIYSYLNNTENVFLSVNGQTVRAEGYEWRKIQSGITKAGKYLGVLR
jgi:hypothetical protein